MYAGVTAGQRRLRYPRYHPRLAGSPAGPDTSAREASVLQARLNLITVDPLLLGDWDKFIENDVRPAVEDELGSMSPHRTA